MNRYLKIFFVLLFAVLLNSCVYDCPNEYKGKVCDKITKKPLENVNIIVLFKDTAINDYGLIYDSIPKAQRIELLKQVENKERWFDPEDNSNRMAKNGPLYTDSTGLYNIRFMTGSCPKGLKILYFKEGYYPSVHEPLSTHDSVIISLTKYN